MEALQAIFPNANSEALRAVLAVTDGDVSAATNFVISAGLNEVEASLHHASMTGLASGEDAASTSQAGAPGAVHVDATDSLAGSYDENDEPYGEDDDEEEEDDSPSWNASKRPRRVEASAPGALQGQKTSLCQFDDDPVLRKCAGLPRLLGLPWLPRLSALKPAPIPVRNVSSRLCPAVLRLNPFPRPCSGHTSSCSTWPRRARPTRASYLPRPRRGATRRGCGLCWPTTPVCRLPAGGCCATLWRRLITCGESWSTLTSARGEPQAAHMGWGGCWHYPRGMGPPATLLLYALERAMRGAGGLSLCRTA